MVKVRSLRRSEGTKLRPSSMSTFKEIFNRICFRKTKNASKHQEDLNIPTSDIPDLPEYYDQIKDSLSDPSKIKLEMTHSSKPTRKALLRDVKDKLAIMISDTFMEFAGQKITKNSQMVDYNQIDNLIIDILSKNELSPKSEMALYAAKQLNGCDQQFFDRYLQIMLIVVTFVKIYDKTLKQFLLDFMSDKLSNDIQFKKHDKTCKYIIMCIQLTNVHTTIVEDANCSEWAVKHLTGSFFDCDLNAQMDFQRKASIDTECPWVIFELCHALKSTSNADINKIMREASDSPEVTRVKLALDKFENIGLSFSKESVFMYVLMVYINSSLIIPQDMRTKLMSIDIDNEPESNEDAVLSIINDLPDINKKVLIYLIYNFKMHFLKNSTEQGHKTARRLLSSYLFNLSNLSTNLNEVMTKIQKASRILQIIFEKYDVSQAETM